MRLVFSKWWWACPCSASCYGERQPRCCSGDPSSAPLLEKARVLWCSTTSTGDGIQPWEESIDPGLGGPSGIWQSCTVPSLSTTQTGPGREEHRGQRCHGHPPAGKGDACMRYVEQPERCWIKAGLWGDRGGHLLHQRVCRVPSMSPPSLLPQDGKWHFKNEMTRKHSGAPEKVASWWEITLSMGCVLADLQIMDRKTIFDIIINK